MKFAMNKRFVAAALPAAVALALGVAPDAEAGIKIKPPKIKAPKLPKIRGDVGKVLGHAGKELRNLGGNAVEAVEVIAKTGERTLHSTGDALAAAGKRLEDGKIVDAVWHLGTDPLKSAEKNTLLAMQESSALRMVGQVAATAYGGPAGAAVFSAYYVGRTTGDMGKGLRAGVISGASSYVLGQIGEGPGTDAIDVAARAVASGVVGGTASVASGGEFESGALHAVASSALRDGYRAYTGTDPDGRAGKGNISKGTAQACAGRPDCHVVETADDMRNLVKDYPARNHIGEFNKNVARPWWKIRVTQEGGAVSQAANVIPGMNAMAIGHDIWSLDVGMGDFANRATIPLAILPSYVALGANRNAALLKNAEERKNER